MFFVSYLLGLLAKIKCSICSYQLNLWYGGHCPPSRLNLFLHRVGDHTMWPRYCTHPPSVAGSFGYHPNQVSEDKYKSQHFFCLRHCLAHKFAILACRYRMVKAMKTVSYLPGAAVALGALSGRSLRSGCHSSTQHCTLLFAMLSGIRKTHNFC